MATETEIANMALMRVGTKTITDISEATTEAGYVRTVFPIALRAELRSHAWNCAVDRVILAPESSQTPFGNLYKYRLPVDCLRPLNAEDNDWGIEGRYIVTADYPVVNLRYIKLFSDIRDADPMLVDALAVRIAIDLCERIAKSSTKKQQLIAEYKDKIMEARRVNAFERRNEDIPDGQWVSSWEV